MGFGSTFVKDSVQFGIVDELAVTLLDRFQRRDDSVGHVFLEGAIAFAGIGRFDLFVRLVCQSREDFDEVGNARLVFFIVMDGVFAVRLGPLDFLSIAFGSSRR